MNTIEQRLQAIEDIEAIRNLKAAYCCACDDDHNPHGVVPLFVPDGVWRAAGISHCVGHAQIHEYFNAIHTSGSIRNSAHNVMNPQIAVDGDQATGHWRLIMLYTGQGAEGELSWHRIIGTYDDKYVRTREGWRFQELFCQVEENGPYSIADLRNDLQQ